MRRIPALILAYLGLAMGWQCPLARAQTAVALVLEVHGNVQPGVAPYQEIAAETQFTLADDARLVFVHYSTCRMVTAVGGSITFSTQAYTMTGGTKEAEKRVNCPRQVVLKAEGSAAGIVIRGEAGAPALRLSTEPTFVLVGPRANDFAAVQITTKDGVMVLKAPLAGRRFQWPTGAAPLSADAVYALTLLPVRTQAAALTVPFIAIALAGSPRDSGLSLLRVE
jgi:hypothetical protein